MLVLLQGDNYEKRAKQIKYFR